MRAIAEMAIFHDEMRKKLGQVRMLLQRVLESLNSTSTTNNVIDLPDDIVLPMKTLANVDIMY